MEKSSGLESRVHIQCTNIFELSMARVQGAAIPILTLAYWFRTGSSSVELLQWMVHRSIAKVYFVVQQCKGWLLFCSLALFL